MLASTLLLLCLPLGADPEVPDLRSAVTRGLKRLEQGSSSYIKNRQCFSCHHQAVTLAAYQAARQRGLEVSPERLKEQVDYSLAHFKPRLSQIRKGEGMEGGNTMTGYGLFALSAAGYPADEVTAAMVDFLVIRQRGDGSWPATANRPPSEGSKFTTAGLALEALKAYGAATKEPAEDDERAQHIHKVWNRGREWLLENKPVNTEDRTFHLRGLVAGQVDARVIEGARQQLLAEQREDGSWAQLSDRDGDAYATGQVLVALRRAGLPASDRTYQAGIRYLLKTQNADGSWLVTTRSRPIQTFFDNGDPGGKSQFISFLATAWSVTALLEGWPEKE